MAKIDINYYDGFIESNDDLVKTILIAAISIFATYAAYNFSEILFRLILLPCILLLFLLFREWLALITIKTPLKWRRPLHAVGFFLIPYLTTYANGGPSLTIRWLKIEINGFLHNPLYWEEYPMFSYDFIAWVLLTCILITYLTYLNCSPRFNLDKSFPVYPLRVSFYLSLAALIYAFFSTTGNLDLVDAPVFLVVVVLYNFSFVISYLISSYVFSKINLVNNITEQK